MIMNCSASTQDLDLSFFVILSIFQIVFIIYSIILSCSIHSLLIATFSIPLILIMITYNFVHHHLKYIDVYIENNVSKIYTLMDPYILN